MFHTIRAPNGSWSPLWDMALPLGYLGYHNSVGIAKGESETHVCTTTSTGRVYHTIRNSNGGWTGWEDVIQQTGYNLGGQKFISVDCAAVGAELHLVGLTVWPWAGMYHAIRRSDGTWTALNSVNVATGLTAVVNDVDVDTDVAGNLHVIATGASFQLHATRFANGAWTGFGDIEGQAGDPGVQSNGAAVALDDGLYVFDRVDPGALFMTRRAENGAWDAFSNMTTAANSDEAFRTVSVSGVPYQEIIH
jgi:hypothetical protein